MACRFLMRSVPDSRRWVNFGTPASNVTATGMFAPEARVPPRHFAHPRHVDGRFSIKPRALITLFGIGRAVAVLVGAVQVVRQARYKRLQFLAEDDPGLVAAGSV